MKNAFWSKTEKEKQVKKAFLAVVLVVAGLFVGVSVSAHADGAYSGVTSITVNGQKLTGDVNFNIGGPRLVVTTDGQNVRLYDRPMWNEITSLKVNGTQVSGDVALNDLRMSNSDGGTTWLGFMVDRDPNKNVTYITPMFHIQKAH